MLDLEICEVDDRYRMVLPVSWRRAVKLEKGDKLRVQLDIAGERTGLNALIVSKLQVFTNEKMI